MWENIRYAQAVNGSRMPLLADAYLNPMAYSLVAPLTDSSFIRLFPYRMPGSASGLLSGLGLEHSLP